MEKTLEIHTISKIDVMKGKSNVDLTGLAELLIQHSENRLDIEPSHTHYEDSFCPDSPIVDEIIEDLKCAFRTAFGLDLQLHSKWAHIHEKNMSTNIHDHYPCDISSAFYVSVPEGSGQICFYSSHNKYHPTRTVFQPEEGMFFIFPGVLEHSVTRNQSEEKRISLAFNFNVANNKDNNDQQN